MILTEIIRPVVGLVAGGVIGLGFGWLQGLAVARYKKRQQSGDLNSAWAVMPGSMRRVAGLLLALVLIQTLCPLLFVNGSQWWVSAGLVAAYGGLLFWRLRQRKAHSLPPS